jgi:hypothetical protein
MARNMYLDDRQHYDEDKWRTTALRGLAIDVDRLLDIFEPYARSYIGDQAGIRLSEEDILPVESLRQVSALLLGEADA